MNDTPRTQKQRSRKTREKLLDATIECLLELGYAGTTTTVVCERTGLSRGALLHHFPTKQALVIEAVSHLVLKMGAENLRHMRRLSEAPDSLDAMFEVIWANFRQPLFHAALELWVAARTDPALHANLFQVERARGGQIAELYRALAPGAARHAAFDDILALTLHLMRGMALQRLMRQEDSERRRLYDYWKQLATSAVEGSPRLEA